ncbi:MAG TPA: hypothetical protein VJI71_01355 [Candidatus Norongarragalinales archaeon]|nr:hypothetical protein [Candidatus Norongarragalinales archaeon]
MKMLHLMSLAFIAIAIILIAFVFFNTVMKVQSSPTTGFAVGQNQISGQATASQSSADQRAECISNPAKCFG